MGILILKGSSGGGGGGGSPGFTPQSTFTLTALDGSFAHTLRATLDRSSGSFGSHADFNTGNFTWNGHNHLLALFWDVESAANTAGIERRGVAYNLDGGVPDSLADKWALDLSEHPTNLTRSARRFYFGAEQGGMMWFPTSNATQCYTKAKFKLGPNRQAGKFLRPYLASSVSIYNSTGCDNRGWRSISENFSGGDFVHDPTTPTVLFPAGWCNIETWLDCGTDSYIASIDRQVAMSSVGEANFPANFQTGHTFDFGHMVDEPGAARCSSNPSWDGSEWWADVIYNFTRTRLEITTSATYATGSVAEMQVPITWTTTGITFAINMGEHASLSGKHLHFVNTSGTATYVGQFT